MPPTEKRKRSATDTKRASSSIQDFIERHYLDIMSTWLSILEREKKTGGANLTGMDVAERELLRMSVTLASCATCGRRVTRSMSSTSSAVTQSAALGPRCPVRPAAVHVHYAQVIVYTRIVTRGKRLDSLSEPRICLESYPLQKTLALAPLQNCNKRSIKSLGPFSQ